MCCGTLDVDCDCCQLSGEPMESVCQFAKEKEADLVVLGNDVGKEGTPALGQLTRQIVDRLPCTVVVVKDQVNASRSVDAAEQRPSADRPTV